VGVNHALDGEGLTKVKEESHGETGGFEIVQSLFGAHGIRLESRLDLDDNAFVHDKIRAIASYVATPMLELIAHLLERRDSLEAQFHRCRLDVHGFEESISECAMHG
jgi:hypothetical protein